MAQRNLKRLVAYTSVSHMGFVLLGIYAGTAIALQGAILQIICHAFSTGALFAIAGFLQERQLPIQLKVDSPITLLAGAVHDGRAVIARTKPLRLARRRILR